MVKIKNKEKKEHKKRGKQVRKKDYPHMPAPWWEVWGKKFLQRRRTEAEARADHPRQQH